MEEKLLQYVISTCYSSFSIHDNFLNLWLSSLTVQLTCKVCLNDRVTIQKNPNNPVDVLLIFILGAVFKTEDIHIKMILLAY